MAIHESRKALVTPTQLYGDAAAFKPLPEPLRPYLKDDRDPNQIQDEVHRQFYGEHYKGSTLRPQLAYLVPEIVPFDPEWMDPATGLMVNVPNNPDFLSSFVFKRVDASLAIGTYAVDLSYDFPGGGQGSGSSYHGDGIMRFSISRKQIRQELPRERTAIIYRDRPFVQILNKHGEIIQQWIASHCYRSNEDGEGFEIVWHMRSRKARLDRMPMTLDSLYMGLSDIFAAILKCQGLEFLEQEDEELFTLGRMACETTHVDGWPGHLTDINAYRVWRAALMLLANIRDRSKVERHSEACRSMAALDIKRIIRDALKLR